MSDLGRKLQLGSNAVHVVGRPEGVAPDLEGEGDPGPEAGALLVFVRDRAALEEEADGVVRSAAADRLTWVAFPKGGRLGTDLDRNRVAEAFLARGVRPVRNVAIDEVWSALRFRPGA